MHKMFQSKYFLKITQVCSLIACNMCSLCDHEEDTLQLECLLLPAGLDWTGLGWSAFIVILTNWNCYHFMIEFIQCFQMMWWFREQIISHSCGIYASNSWWSKRELHICCSTVNVLRCLLWLLLSLVISFSFRDIWFNSQSSYLFFYKVSAK